MVRRVTAVIALSVFLFSEAFGITAPQCRRRQPAPSKTSNCPSAARCPASRSLVHRTPRRFTGQKFQTFAEMSPEERARMDYDVSRESVDVVVPAVNIPPADGRLTTSRLDWEQWPQNR